MSNTLKEISLMLKQDPDFKNVTYNRNEREVRFVFGDDRPSRSKFILSDSGKYLTAYNVFKGEAVGIWSRSEFSIKKLKDSVFFSLGSSF